MCKFSENQFNYCYTSLTTEINFHLNFPYFIDQIWVKFDTEDLHSKIRYKRFAYNGVEYL